MKIHDVMTRDVTTCRPEDSTSHAAQLMWDHDCGVIPVVDAEQRPVGMITDRDVCMAGFTTGRPLPEIRVGDVMSRNIQACRSEDSIGTAEMAMQQRRVRRLPIIDPQGRLVGLLSLNDLARRAASVNGKSSDPLALEKVAETLASLCEPWFGISARPASRPDATQSPRAAASQLPALTR